MSTYVPLISSGVAGPLGVLHLPRLWLKLSLEATGKLAAGYPGCGKGYDGMTLSALGVDEAAVKGFVKTKKPTYPQFEAWIKANGTSVTAEQWFTFEPQADGTTRLSARQTFDGPMTFMFGESIQKQITAMYDEWLNTLKTQAEQA